MRCPRYDAVHRPIEHGGRVQAVEAQGRDKGVRLPVTEGRVIPHAEPAGAAAITAQEIGRHAGFVEEDVLPSVTYRQPVLPPSACRRDVRASLFVGVYRFF